MLTKTSSSVFVLAALATSVWAQAPTNLKATAATNKRVDLTWKGTASSYPVQRRALGASYASIPTAVSTASYSDATIDAFTTYQYQVLATGGNLVRSGGSASRQHLILIRGERVDSRVRIGR